MYLVKINWGFGFVMVGTPTFFIVPTSDSEKHQYRNSFLIIFPLFSTRYINNGGSRFRGR